VRQRFLGHLSDNLENGLKCLFPEISYTIRPHLSEDGKIDGKTIGFVATPYFFDNMEPYYRLT
jgi:hypothetical protein